METIGDSHMRLVTGRNHEHFNLDGGMPQGVGYVVRPAKDPIAREPEDGMIGLLLRRTLCRARLDEEARLWRITGMTGRSVLMQFSASFGEWESECNQLLKEALASES